MDDLVPVKRSFVDAARPVRPCWRAVGGPATVVACPAGGGGGGGGPTVVAVPPGQAAFEEAVDDFYPDNMLMLSPLLTLPIVQRRLS